MRVRNYLNLHLIHVVHKAIVQNTSYKVDKIHVGIYIYCRLFHHLVY